MKIPRKLLICNFSLLKEGEQESKLVNPKFDKWFVFLYNFVIL